MERKAVLTYLTHLMESGFTGNLPGNLFFIRLLGMGIGIFLVFLGTKFKGLSAALIVFLLIGPFLLFDTAEKWANDLIRALIVYIHNFKTRFPLSTLALLAFCCYFSFINHMFLKQIMTIYGCKLFLQIVNILSFKVASRLFGKLSDDIALVFYLQLFILTYHFMFKVFDFCARTMINIFYTIIGGSIFLLSILTINNIDNTLTEDEKNQLENNCYGFWGSVLISVLFFVSVFLNEIMFKKRTPKNLEEEERKLFV